MEDFACNGMAKVLLFRIFALEVPDLSDHVCYSGVSIWWPHVSRMGYVQTSGKQILQPVTFPLRLPVRCSIYCAHSIHDYLSSRSIAAVQHT